MKCYRYQTFISVGLQKQFTFQAPSFITIAVSTIIPGFNYGKQCEKAKLDMKFKNKTKFYTFQSHNCCFFSLALFWWIFFGRFRQKLPILKLNNCAKPKPENFCLLLLLFFCLFVFKNNQIQRKSPYPLSLHQDYLITGTKVNISINFSLAAAAGANIIKSQQSKHGNDRKWILFYLIWSAVVASFSVVVCLLFLGFFLIFFLCHGLTDSEQVWEQERCLSIALQNPWKRASLWK